MDQTDQTRRVLVTGATGYVGGSLIPALLEAGHTVRALVRNPDSAELDDRVEVVKGDVVEGEGLAEALAGIEVAYYLVHSMGGSGGDDFVERDREAARHVGEAARDAGVERVIYLGGLEDPADAGDNPSEHLRSRAEVAEVLGELVPRLIHVRAAMVLGAGSASYQMLEGLVHRLPLMVTPSWVGTRTQPVAIADVVATLTRLAVFDDPPDEVQLGGADVLTYREMLARMAVVEGRREPTLIPAPFVPPGFSALWVSLVSGVERGVVRPLVDGLVVETVVREPPPPGINDHPLGFDDAVRAAMAP